MQSLMFPQGTLQFYPTGFLLDTLWERRVSWSHTLHTTLFGAPAHEVVSSFVAMAYDPAALDIPFSSYMRLVRRRFRWRRLAWVALSGCLGALRSRFRLPWRANGAPAGGKAGKNRNQPPKGQKPQAPRANLPAAPPVANPAQLPGQRANNPLQPAAPQNPAAAPNPAAQRMAGP
jgi:hypothetical protein